MSRARTLVLPVAVTVVVLAGCTPPPDSTASDPTTGQDAAVDTTETAAVDTPRTAALEVSEWPGREFAALPMSPTFARFGYEIYPTARMADETAPVDEALQLRNRRYTCQALVGKTLQVDSVAPDGDEFTVIMTLAGSQLRAYAPTHGQAVKGIALTTDIDNARERWTGKTLYARKRQINTYDSTGGKMGSIKVGIDTPLKVTGVRWGALPLPPQPIWIWVATPDSQTGFVPTYFSWTNVLQSKRRDSSPWTEFILEEDPRAAHQWSEEMWAKVNAHKLETGMTPEQARLTWGDPLSREERDDGSLRWTYAGQYLVFSNGKLVRTEPR